MIDVQAFLLAVAVSAREVILEGWRRDSCIETTKTVIGVASRYGIELRPVRVVTHIFNPFFSEMMMAGKSPTKDPRGHIIIIGDPKTPRLPGAWPGHLVAIGAGYLVDGSIDQADRPKKNIRLSPLVRPLGDDDYLTTQMGGCILRYELRPDVDHERTPAWNRSEVDEAISEAALRLEQAMSTLR